MASSAPPYLTTTTIFFEVLTRATVGRAKPLPLPGSQRKWILYQDREGGAAQKLTGLTVCLLAYLLAEGGSCCGRAWSTFWHEWPISMAAFSQDSGLLPKEGTHVGDAFFLLVPPGTFQLKFLPIFTQAVKRKNTTRPLIGLIVGTE